MGSKVRLSWFHFYYCVKLELREVYLITLTTFKPFCVLCIIVDRIHQIFLEILCLITTKSAFELTCHIGILLGWKLSPVVFYR